MSRKINMMLDSSRQRENEAILSWAQKSGVELYSDLGANLCSVLVANAPSSINMIFGARAALWVNYVMQGLDINSRVVFSMSEAEYATELKQILRSDLRYSVHCQDYLSFVDDIRRYQITLLILDASLGEVLFEKTADLLDQSGYAVILGDESAHWQLEGYQVAELEFNGQKVILLTKRAALAMPKTRKGGRGGRRRSAT